MRRMMIGSNRTWWRSLAVCLSLLVPLFVAGCGSSHSTGPSSQVSAAAGPGGSGGSGTSGGADPTCNANVSASNGGDSGGAPITVTATNSNVNTCGNTVAPTPAPKT
ncbi:MAG TPA: hypothetical protein VFC42_05875, partial [Methylomirabilota bacterium]|nr:hypothetical protein [Methylomirabilota bacterium]